MIHLQAVKIANPPPNFYGRRDTPHSETIAQRGVEAREIRLLEGVVWIEWASGDLIGYPLALFSSVAHAYVGFPP